VIAPYLVIPFRSGDCESSLVRHLPSIPLASQPIVLWPYSQNPFRQRVIRMVFDPITLGNQGLGLLRLYSDCERVGSLPSSATGLGKRLLVRREGGAA
jgi:hypothetical protein